MINVISCKDRDNFITIITIIFAVVFNTILHYTMVT